VRIASTRRVQALLVRLARFFLGHPVLLEQLED
jgi:hypothetical protein